MIKKHIRTNKIKKHQEKNPHKKMNRFKEFFTLKNFKKYHRNLMIYIDLLRLRNTDIIASKPILWGLAITFIFFGAFIIWGSTADLESASIAKGTVTVSSGNKFVQHLEGGIIKDILVKNGDIVQLGQPLIALDETITGSSMTHIEQQNYALKLRKERLKAEIANNDLESFSEILKEKTNNNSELQEFYDNELNLFKTRQEQFTAEKNVLDQRIIQAQEEIKGLELQTIALTEQITLLNKDLSQENELLKDGYSTLSAINKVKQKIALVEGEKGENFSNIAKARLKLKESQLEKTNFKVNHLSEINEELQNTLVKKSTLDEKITSTKSILDRHIITAPQTGKITNLALQTIGGIIAPREVIMEIVPQNDALIIKAKIHPKDIDIVYEGLPAQIKLTSFNLRNLPIIHGKVTSISADKITDVNTNESYYLADITIDDFQLPKNIDAKIYPGMPADILIVTGHRTFFSYLFEPLTNTIRHSFRET